MEKEDPDLLDDAIEEITEEDGQVEAEDAEEEVDLCWEAVEQTTYARLPRLEDAFHGRCSIRVPRGSSLARYFVSFLPICHILSVVIPAINLHATTLTSSWTLAALPEYLTWIDLFIIMSTIVIPDKKSYCHKSGFAFGPRIDFTNWMTMDRFNATSKMHIFVIPDARACTADKLYKLRTFIDAYNENLNVVIPGRYLYVDEPMNQWLGHGMPNLKKIPRKPRSIRQEYKTTADVNTCCIIRFDTTGDNTQKKVESIFPKTIAIVLRFVEPWSSSGRTVIADSWFDSPAMVRAVKTYGLLLDQASEKEEILA